MPTMLSKRRTSRFCTRTAAPASANTAQAASPTSVPSSKTTAERNPRASPRRIASALAARTLVGDAGSAFLLERYALHRAAPVLAMQAVTDGLVRLFGTSFPLVKLARNGGMRVVDALGPLKRLLAQPALR